MRAFFDDLFLFDQFDELGKDVARYPLFSTAMAEDAREQTLRFVVEKLVNEKADYRSLYTARGNVVITQDATTLKADWMAYNTQTRRGVASGIRSSEPKTRSNIASSAPHASHPAACRRSAPASASGRSPSRRSWIRSCSVQAFMLGSVLPDVS